MNNTKRFSLTLETLAKLATETNSIHSTPSIALPSLNSVLTEFAPLPRAALFLGLATDGLPILLNLLDPLPGPIMITGDEGSGKTNFLKIITGALDRVQTSNEASYTVITDDPAEWKDFQQSNNCENIFSAHESKIPAYLHSIVEWAHSNKGGQQIRLLMIDQLNSLLEIPEAQQDLSWLLLRGPSRRVWPIVTINSSIAVSNDFRPWLDSFRTRLFGFIHDDRETQLLTGSSSISFTHLMAGFQFVMREGYDWLPFWIPALD
ncbi:MAG: hypothetical protein WBW94_11525 [Anaerolineales bacterium]